MGDAAKGFIALVAVVLVAGVYGVTNVAWQERSEEGAAEARAQEARARAAESESRVQENRQAADRRAEERMYGDGGAPSKGQLEADLEAAEVELREREEAEAGWLASHTDGLQEGEADLVHQANYIHAMVALASAERDMALWRLRAFEDHARMLDAREGGEGEGKVASAR